ncbi:hypothetical protein IAU60_000900 [Kwoniella sp. DSM 27419]
MYWYISFLRPPPVSIPSTAEGVTITPQVANDLRTEVRYEPTIIRYQWQRLLPTPISPTPSQELTVFEPPMSTYKPISIPLPARTQAGETWRLGLFSADPGAGDTPAEGPSSLLSLCGDEPGVLGVWSEGIQITRPSLPAGGAVRGVNAKTNGKKEKEVEGKSRNAGKGKGKEKEKEKEKDEGPKQGRITREFGLPSSGSLRVVEQTSFDLDKKVWDSGLALSAWLWRYLPETTAERISHPQMEKHVSQLRRTKPLRLLEIGSGTGLVSIALAMAFKRYLPNVKRVITATDLGSAIPLMDENISLNGLSDGAASRSQDAGTSTSNGGPETHLDAKVLDWDEPIPTWVDEDRPELIIAADVTYNTSAFPSLLSTLTALLRPDERITPRLILAYKQRDPAERDLWDMLRDKGIGMVMVDVVKGAEEEGHTEIWLGEAGLET